MYRGKRGYAAKRVLLFTNAATPFSDTNLQIIVDSLRRQDIIVDAIGPTWGQQDEGNDDDDGHQDNRPGSPMQTNGHDQEASASARPTTSNNNHHQSPKKPLTPQQKTGIRVISDIVNTTDGSLFTFR